MLLGRLFRTRTRRWVGVGVVAVVSLSTLIVAQSWGDDPAAVETRPVTIAVAAGPDATGTIDIDATVYVPSATPAPAVIVAHGFGGSKASVAEDAQRLAEEGFVTLAYSARGFGASGGQIALDSLDYEVADARALVDYLAGLPEVRLDNPDDPRVGVTGGSYGGALALMLAGTDSRIDAVAAVATWNSLEQALFPNNLAGEVMGSNPQDPSAPLTTGTPGHVPAMADGVYKQGWAAALITSIIGASLNDSPERDAPTAPGTASALSPGAAIPGQSTPGCGRLTLTLCAAYTDAAQTGRISRAMSALLQRSSPAQVAAEITAPTLLVQGEADTLFGLDQADANARAIASAGTPVAVTWYPGGHNGAAPDAATTARIDAWFHYYLGGTGATPSLAFQYSVAGPVAQRGQARVRTLQVDGYPGIGQAPMVATEQVPISGSPQVVINPPGGQPAAITSLPGVSSAVPALGSLGALPGQTALFASAPVEKSLVVTGSIPVTLSVSRVLTGQAMGNADKTDAVFYLSVVKLAAQPAAESPASGDGAGAALAALAAAPVAGAVAPIRIPDVPADGTEVTVTVKLPAVAVQVPADGRLGVRVATTDQGYFGDTAPAVYRVVLDDAELTVPAAAGTRAPGVDDGEPVPLAIGLAVLLVLMVVGLYLAGRTRRRAVYSRVERAPGRVGRAPGRAVHAPGRAVHAPGRADVALSTPPADPEVSAVDVPTADTAPLVIRGLAKQYPGGVTAVADVSFTVERGQVLGLLGPNGAGKTTTLRMVMGLIAPTAGDISIFGEPARPGAPVLSRIGSFVEGSGFLPHLSGRANLDLYWRATGRPATDAHIEEALAIADLGTAVARKVKTYSQGMRQRLAIAQAMLGLPDLLLLDEPTNGLDPPQIHAMREVLRRYAGTGRTVLVSSHLLSEVEQTCTHVVVMSRGRTIAAGTVAELVAASGDVTIGTPEPQSAAQVLAAAGVADADIQASGITVDLRTFGLNEALRALLDAGIEVTSAAPRNRLEDVFLDLVGSGPAGGESSLEPGESAAEVSESQSAGREELP